MAERVLLPPDVTMALAHDSFRFSLASAPALIHSATGDDVRRGLIAEYFTNALLGLEVHHHGEEELYFPLLIERFPEEREKVDLGRKQHHEVLSLLEAASDAVTQWGAKGDPESAKVLASLVALEEALSVHLEYEEKSIVPLEDGLTPEDRTICLDHMREHHVARIPDLPLVLLSLGHGRAYLWQAVGEGSLRDMIAKVPGTG
jgi:iron-sulfur cluster repair protein YtfE (RIC family)